VLQETIVTEMKHGREEGAGRGKQQWQKGVRRIKSEVVGRLAIKEAGLSSWRGGGVPGRGRCDGLLRSGLAWAIQDHEDAWPKWARARVQRVSPDWTLILGAEFGVGLTSGEIDGTRIREPTEMRFGFEMLGFAATRSCQRRPWPRFCCASFQRESPERTVTVRAALTVGAETFGITEMTG
jgi:hypothetical protein